MGTAPAHKAETSRVPQEKSRGVSRRIFRASRKTIISVKTLLALKPDLPELLANDLNDVEIIIDIANLCSQ
jgi:hypothetical protein